MSPAALQKSGSSRSLASITSRTALKRAAGTLPARAVTSTAITFIAG